MLLRNIFAVLTSLLLLTCLSSCGSLAKREQGPLTARQELVYELQNFELLFGFAPTNNFKTYDDTTEAVYLCYYAEKLDLTTHFIQGTKDGCPVDKSKYDVYFYSAQAVAGVDTPLLSSLAKAPLGRFIMVVFHEDFHEQVVGIPTSALNESSATLMGLLLAQEFAYKKYGAESEQAKIIITDIDLFLRASLITERYAALFRRLYENVARGEVSHEEGLHQKDELFDQMKNECAPLQSTLLYACSEIHNNAEFGYRLSYTTYYPLFSRLYDACGKDVRVFGTTIIALVHEHLSEQEFILRVQEIINAKRT